MSGVVGKAKRGVFKLLDQFFSDPEAVETITYKVFAGRDDDGDQVYTTFSAPVIVRDHVSEKSPLFEAMKQSGSRHYTIRESDLPGLLTHKSLTPNDLVVVGGDECRVVELAKAPGFVIAFVAMGNQ